MEEETIYTNNKNKTTHKPLNGLIEREPEREPDLLDNDKTVMISS